MKRISIAVGLLLCILGGTVIFIFLKQDRFNPVNCLRTIPKQVKYSYTLQNTSNKSLKDIRFWVYGPVGQTAWQLSREILPSFPCKITEDPLGNQLLEFTFEQFPPFGTKIISITANLLMSETPCPVPANGVSGFLAPEKNIESDHPEIMKQAALLKGETVLKTSENIFFWVSRHISYEGYVNQDRGALYAFTNKKGDCTEYMALFVALCRANGIPARGIAGYICPESCRLKKSGLHNWAEFYDGKYWRTVDPQNTIFDKNSNNYIAIRIIGGQDSEPMRGANRFCIQDPNIKVEMN